MHDHHQGDLRVTIVDIQDSIVVAFFCQHSQVTCHLIQAEDSSYQSLPQMPSSPGQTVQQDCRPHPPNGGMPYPQYGNVSHPQYGNGSRPQHEDMQYRPYGGNLHLRDSDLEGKDSPPNSTQPGHAQFLLNVNVGRLSQQWQQQQQHFQSLPQAHSTLELEESDVSVDSILPSPMTYHPGQDAMTYGHDTSFQPNQRYIGDEINREISPEARQYKKLNVVEQGVPAPDDIDESIWSSSIKDLDPNVGSLQCHCLCVRLSVCNLFDFQGYLYTNRCEWVRHHGL